LFQFYISEEKKAACTPACICNNNNQVTKTGHARHWAHWGIFQGELLFKILKFTDTNERKILNKLLNTPA